VSRLKHFLLLSFNGYKNQPIDGEGKIGELEAAVRATGGGVPEVSRLHHDAGMALLTKQGFHTLPFLQLAANKCATKGDIPKCCCVNIWNSVLPVRFPGRNY
jgi:hypothetical protein